MDLRIPLSHNATAMLPLQPSLRALRGFCSMPDFFSVCWKTSACGFDHARRFTWELPDKTKFILSGNLLH
jgi:hypothetical protein